MAGMQGEGEFREFADSMMNISGEGRGDGIGKAKRDALRATADDFIDILVEQIQATSTAKGGTLDSRTSPYDTAGPTGSNESSDSNHHMADKNAWDKTLVGDDYGVIFPKPDVHHRASWLEYGTSDHGPAGDMPMYFKVGNTRIVVADPPKKGDSFRDQYVQSRAVSDNPQDALFGSYVEPGEVSGVEPQGFFKRAVQIADETDIFKENMGEQIDQLFAEEQLILAGDW